MVANLKDVAAAQTSSSNDEKVLEELRETVVGLAKDVAAVAETRAKQGVQAVETGTSMLRQEIRRQPALSMGAAAATGALLAVLLVPKSRDRKTSRSSWSDWSPVTRSDLEDVADNLQRSMKRATRTVSSVPLSSSLERLTDALTRAERETGFSSALEKAGSWLHKMQQSASQKTS